MNDENEVKKKNICVLIFKLSSIIIKIKFLLFKKKKNNQMFSNPLPSYSEVIQDSSNRNSIVINSSDNSDPPSYDDVILESAIENLSLLIQISANNYAIPNTRRNSDISHNNDYHLYRSNVNRTRRINSSHGYQSRLSLQPTSINVANGLTHNNTTPRRLSLQQTTQHSNGSRYLETSRATLKSYANFNVNHDVLQLHKALIETDKDALIEILCRRSCDQRLKIIELYNCSYVSSFFNMTESILPSVFSELIRGLSMPLHIYLCRSIIKSTSLNWICYIVSVLPNSTREMMQECFQLSKYIIIQSIAFTFKR